MDFSHLYEQFTFLSGARNREGKWGINVKRFILFFLLSLNLFAAEIPTQKKIVLILGDSLTEGYGVAKSKSFPAVLEGLIQKKGRIEVQFVVSGVSGATTASGLQRLKRHLSAKPNILVLALGANDGLRGFKINETKKNLKEILAQAKANNLKILLVGMKLPPNYGKAYALEFEKMYSDLAREEKISLMPFLLEGVGGESDFNLEDGIHPNEKGHEIIAKNLLVYLERLL